MKQEINFEKITEGIENTEANILLKELPNYFKFQDNIQQTAYLNWRFDRHDKIESQFFNLAEGYFAVAIHLIAECLKDNYSRKADIWIFPILFNIVHGIEIYLKGFNSLYPIYIKLNNYGESGDSSIEGNHNIHQLCNVAISKVKNSSEKEFFADLKFVKKFIDILYANTDDMSFARYSMSKDNQQQFYVSSTNVTIDLPTLYIWATKVSQILENICSSVYYGVCELEDFKTEEERWYADEW